MSYGNEWLLFESGDDIDEMEHRQPSEEFLFYHAVAGGDVRAERPGSKSKVPFRYYNGNGDSLMQTKRHGAGTGVSAE